MHKLWIPVLLFFLLPDLWSGGRCGFDRLAQQPKTVSKLSQARLTALNGNCPPEALYESVQIDTTDHFRIYYTTKGPHAVAGASLDTAKRPLFVDSLMRWLEDAYHLHTVLIGMLPPLGMPVSHQYQRTEFPDKYPVEIVDIGLLRKGYTIFDGDVCAYCYGLTLPDMDNNDYQHSGLLIENDFISQETSDPLTVSQPYFGGTCSYTESTRPIILQYQGKIVDYSKEWLKALKVTVFHELYHACQLRYQDYQQYYHFWFEASAVGVENMGAPEVNDYFQYVPTALANPQGSLVSLSYTNPYSQGIFYQSLVHRLGMDMDPKIWTSLSAQPAIAVENHMNAVLQAEGVSGGLPELFHTHAKNLFYSGSRSNGLAKASHPSEDLGSWPSLALVGGYPQSLNLPPFAFQVFLEGHIPESWETQDKIRSSSFSYRDSSFVMLSSGFSSVTITDDFIPPKRYPKAWPNPWRRSGIHALSQLCLDPASADAGIEIRDASGLIVLEIKKTEGSCSSGFVVPAKTVLAPGLYYWRGKTARVMQKLLVIQ